MAYGAILGQKPDSYSKNEIINSNILEDFGLSSDANPADVFQAISHQLQLSTESTFQKLITGRLI